MSTRGLDRAGKGARLRREGLNTSLISEWRKQRDQGALAAFTQKRGRPEVDPREREVARLRTELARAESELDKARKVIEIQSKLRRGGNGVTRVLNTRYRSWSYSCEPIKPVRPDGRA